MKTITKIGLMLMLCTCNLSIYAQQKGYTINGKVKNVPNGTIFYLIKTNERGGADTVTKVKSINGSFSMKGVLKIVPEMHFIRMDTTLAKLPPKTKTWTPVLLDNKAISIKGDRNTWPKVTIEGSSVTNDYESIAGLVAAKIKDGNDKIIAANGEVPKDSLKIANLIQESLQSVIKIFKSYPDAYATPLLASNMKTLDLSSQEEIYNILSPKVKNSFYGMRLKKLLNSLNEGLQIKPGGMIPAFSIQSPNGKDMQVREQIAKYKLTLIDFWASWCTPCRSEVPNLLKVYNAFHERGFNIIGISSDSKKEAWEKALKEDNTPWMHGLEKTSNKVGKELFRLQSIPAFALIDQNGKLLAFNRGMAAIKAFGPDIRGEELYGTIEKLLNEMEKK